MLLNAWQWNNPPPAPQEKINKKEKDALLYGRSMNIISSLAWFYSLRVKALFCLSENLQQTLLLGDGICWKSLVPASGNFKFTDTLTQTAFIEQVKNL